MSFLNIHREQMTGSRQMGSLYEYRLWGWAVAQWLACWTANHEVQGSGQKFGSRYLLHLHPLANSAMMSTLTAVHCQWEDETVRGRTGHPPSYAEAKKMKSLTLHTHGCLRDSLIKGLIFFFFCTYMHFIYCTMYISFGYCSEWIGSL